MATNARMCAPGGGSADGQTTRASPWVSPSTEGSMPTERASPRGIDTRTESLDEPMGSIEFGPRRAAITSPDADAMGEDAKPSSSSNLAGREDAAVRKAELRHRSE